MTNTEKRVVVIDAIVLLLFLVIAFATPFHKNAAFWVSLIFGVIAIGIQFYVLKNAFTKGNDPKSRFYGFPIARIGICYMVCQIVLSLVCMTAGVFIEVPLWIPVIVYVLILGISAIGFISSDAMRDEIEHLDKVLAANTECMQNLRSIVYPLSGQTSDAEAKKVLEELSDEFRYSDPVSSDVIKNIEQELTELVYELQKTVIDADYRAIPEMCRKITGVLTERNRLCRLNKKR